MSSNTHNPAIVIASFGSTRRGRSALERLIKLVEERYPEHRVLLATTSSFIRKRTGAPGLQEVFQLLVDEGYGKAAVLPLQVFPGHEYREVVKAASEFKGIESVVGDTLMHHREFMSHVIEAVKSEFLSPDQGENLLAVHGATVKDDPVNTVYLEFAELVQEQYENCRVASIEGIPSFDELLPTLLGDMRDREKQRIRLIPILYVAGLHVEEDLMGEEKSWKSRLEENGFSVECMRLGGKENHYKSLASNEQIQGMFLERLEQVYALLSKP